MTDPLAFFGESWPYKFNDENIRRAAATLAATGISGQDAVRAFASLPPPSPEELAMLDAAVRRRGLDYPKWARPAVRWWRGRHD